jgi:hypothetical protein
MFAQNWTMADNYGTADRSVTSLGQHNLGYGRAAANLKPRRLMLPFALKNPRNPALIGGVLSFTASPGGHMQPANQPTKAEERALLRELAEQRQSQTPEHVDPAWMTAYWLRKGLLS